MPSHAIRTLLTDLIDYAGLFPPAKLDMAHAVEEYNRCRMGEREWMLQRFICPVSRLGEFARCAGPLMPGTAGTSGYREMAGAGEPWKLSVLLEPGPGNDIEQDLEAIAAFNDAHAEEQNGLAVIDTCEVRIAAPTDVDVILDQMLEDVSTFFEFPVTTDCRGFIAALSGSPAAAKIRTGGVVGNAFPTVAEVSAFLHACHGADVPFKATAGLHHPVRGTHRLTYEKESASCTMHGFVNLFVAACLVRSGKSDDRITQLVLKEEDPSAFRFSDQVLGWKDYLVETMMVARARETFALSFGSCSFEEPVHDLQRMGVLAP
jgi:hypothetical protein